MTKADIIDRIANGTGLTKIDTEAVVDGFFKTIIDALASGNGIEIRGFGSFRVKKKNPRNARNPRTGEKVFVGEHFVPAFKFSKDFKGAVDLGMKTQKDVE
ncbi:MAG: integration host factor subunit beta [Stygiobacter sp. RIFOXYC12_FULL_38_8]|nr:MAG: integration host factor subunit beta [Stygiobacter sp. GWC2_38_9]OGV09132.1 MAG: integration host factor subunit beta [Stygiobacter sp. RIFOXYB2_FULL_37_11]OGV10861.1 MAG: integration host factor subunit beta [Stygiobacter sp. RIFOXYA2_FULL_38_8]OGV16359.1 MAG: integration host factor subunit beta [Stygiobacter sp. RIFOXYC2_FULL_38_25]OGV27585.1 MAG: integration host factor subunit beta [Stygiobacter sp. RIFOXYC12_FULL_38_8]OGV81549.1 MAG: integration host factor subunit beta [Stygioba